MRWDQGRTLIEQMLATGDLQRVPPSEVHAQRLMAQALRHLEPSASDLQFTDPEAAYAVLYDAARKTLAALLENQGLRATSSGGHLAYYNAALAQLEPPLGEKLRPFDRMRRRRRDAEYPMSNAPEITSHDVSEDIPKVQVIFAVVEKMLGEMSPF